MLLTIVKPTAFVIEYHPVFCVECKIRPRIVFLPVVLSKTEAYDTGQCVRMASAN